jgi:EAL domain-containing protein (putative c-di-GMP-specific phosphodiesterase class I)
LQRAEDLLREADIALSVAKRTEGVKTVAYSPTMGGDAASLVSLEADLHLALERNELRLLYQPIVDLRTRKAVGVEALLRWQHPVEGLLAPDKFLAIAEEAGLMAPITRWIIGRVCKLAGDWRQRLEPGHAFYVSINLSAASLRDPYLGEFVASTLAHAHAPASALKFEITEAGLINHVGEAREQLRRLHDMGIELMLDDFGTGYSSLASLRKFPISQVKLDKDLLAGVPGDAAAEAIVGGSIEIAHGVGATVVAEGIETGAQWRFAFLMGCDVAQGYLIGRPATGDDLTELLEAPRLVPLTAA